MSSNKKTDELKTLESAFQQLLKTSKIRRNLTRRYDWDEVTTQIQEHKIVNINEVMKFAGSRSHQHVRQWVERQVINQDIEKPQDITNPDGFLYRYKKDGLVFYVHKESLKEFIASKK